MAQADQEEINLNAYESDFEEEEDESLLQEDISLFVDELKTHRDLKPRYSGIITDLKKGYSKVQLTTTSDMTLDQEGLIHSGFVYLAADYAASVAINEENLIVIGSKIGFYAPAKLGDIIEFEAKSRFEDTKKREVQVIGKISDIKVFEGTFQLVILDDHIFNIKTKNARKKYGKKVDKSK